MTEPAADVPRVSVVVVSWNTCDLLRQCLQAVRDQQGPPLECTVVDNASTDGSAAMVKQEFSEFTLIANQDNRGYAGGVNQGIKATRGAASSGNHARGDFVLLLGSDTELSPDAVQRLVEFLQGSPEYAAVVPQLRDPDGSVQRSCVRIPTLSAAFLHDSLFDRLLGGTKSVSHYLMQDFDHRSNADVEQPQSTAMLLRGEVIESLGGFDEQLFVFYNDVDFCRRMAAAGLKIRFLADVSVLHHHGRSTRQLPDFVAELNVNRVRYFRKHHGIRGVLVVKSWAVLRGLEEAVKIVSRSSRAANLRKLWRSICSILAA